MSISIKITWPILNKNIEFPHYNSLEIGFNGEDKLYYDIWINGIQHSNLVEKGGVFLVLKGEENEQG